MLHAYSTCCIACIQIRMSQWALISGQALLACLSNLIHLPMWTANPFMWTVVRLTWGHAPSCQPLCFIACVNCLFLPDQIKATGQYWNAHFILVFPFISHGFYHTAASLATDRCSPVRNSQQGVFKNLKKVRNCYLSIVWHWGSRQKLGSTWLTFGNK